MKRRRRGTGPDPLAVAIRDVVEADLCSGCGGCALVSQRVSMAIDDEGYCRPIVSQPATGSSLVVASEDDTRRFLAMCPGVGLRAPATTSESRRDAVFGTYLKVWTAWAADDEVRSAGSSAGVLSAIQLYTLERTRGSVVVASGPDEADPRRTAAGAVADRAAVLRNTGSRYAPVAALSAVPIELSDPPAVIVGKPCEASAFRQLRGFDGVPVASQPLILSFFCAGTPSQKATDTLVEKMGVPFVDVTSVRYRGDGWPGSFRIERTDGPPVAMSYNESWGTYLGPAVQTRCKLCVDGTGGHADIAVGDYWQGDENGFPTFEESDGNSIVIARTDRGLAVIASMIADGALVVAPVDIATAHALQPLQSLRKTTLVARLLGRRAAGGRIPRFRGYGLARIQAANYRSFPRALVGTFVRTRESSS